MAVNQTATSSILESSKIEVISVMHKWMSEFLPRCMQSFLLRYPLNLSVSYLPLSRHTLELKLEPCKVHTSLIYAHKDIHVSGLQHRV